MKDILRHSREFLRSLRNKHYDRNDRGDLILPDQKIVFAGSVGIRNITAGEDWVENRNMVVLQGINYLLTTGLTSSWYFAPYAANVAPVNTLTAANFASTQTEFTNYVETSRRQCTLVTTGSTATNAASPATLTIGAGGQTSAYGVGVASAPAKSATTGTLLACAAFAVGRTGLQSTDEYGLRYTLTGTST